MGKPVFVRDRRHAQEEKRSNPDGSHKNVKGCWKSIPCSVRRERRDQRTQTGGWIKRDVDTTGRDKQKKELQKSGPSRGKGTYKESQRGYVKKLRHPGQNHSFYGQHGKGNHITKQKRGEGQWVARYSRFGKKALLKTEKLLLTNKMRKSNLNKTGRLRMNIENKSGGKQALRGRVRLRKGGGVRMCVRKRKRLVREGPLKKTKDEALHLKDITCHKKKKRT